MHKVLKIHCISFKFYDSYFKATVVPYPVDKMLVAVNMSYVVVVGLKFNVRIDVSDKNIQ